MDYYNYMLLFKFVIYLCKSTQEQNVSNNLPSFIPTCFVSGLGIVEHSVVIAELANSSPAIRRCKIRG